MQNVGQDVQVLKTLDTDTHKLLLKETTLSYLLNGDISDYNNNSYNYFVQNVASNELCLDLKGKEFKGYIKIDADEYVLFLENKTKQEIVLFKADTCWTKVLVEAKCLFKDYVKGVYKYVKACNTRRIYFISNDTPVRYFDIDECLPKVQLNDCRNCEEVYGDFECDLLNINKNIHITKPDIKTYNVGNLPNGVYQIAIAYGYDGIRYSDYYIYPEVIKLHSNNNAFNRFSIDIDFKCHKNDFDTYEVVLISNREDRGNVAQIVGKFETTQTKITITDLDNVRYIPVDFSILLETKVNYTSAQHIATNSDTLVLAGLKERPEFNVQKNLLDIDSEWVVIQVPAQKAHNYKSFLRDEVYPFELRYVYEDGSSTNWGHIPSNAERFVSPSVFNNAPNNADHFELEDDNCDKNPKKYWQIYNTATIINSGPPDPPTGCTRYFLLHKIEFELIEHSYRYIDCCTNEEITETTVGGGFIQCVKNGELYYEPTVYEVQDLGPCSDCEAVDPACDEIEIMRGKFAYWESNINYPDNPCAFKQRTNPEGEFYSQYGLSCTPIKYHKFPDNAITNHYTKLNDTCNAEPFVNILTVQFKNIPYPTDDKGIPIPGIVGYEIGVGDRTNNKSILHKGLIYNMWKEDLVDCSSSYYANYPFNDLNPDNFLGKKLVRQHDTVIPGDDDGFEPIDTSYIQQDRFQYISPDVAYVRNDVGTELVLYTEFNGKAEGYYKEMFDFPKVTILSGIAYGIASTLAIAAAIGLASPVEAAISTYNSLINTIKNFTKRVNYAIYYLVKGNYNTHRTDSVVIGNKRRRIDFGQYMLPTRMKAGNDKINNAQREQYLYLKLHDDIENPSTEEYSRVLITENDCKVYFSGCDTINGKEPNISSYYAGIKIDKPDQYGFLTDFQVKKISTLTYFNDAVLSNSDVLFGGDVYISKHKIIKKFPFFNRLPYQLSDNSYFDLRPEFNVWSPRFWLDYQDDNEYLQALINVTGVAGAVIGTVFDKKTYNLEKIGRVNQNTCFDDDENGNCLDDLYVGNLPADVALYIAQVTQGKELYALRQNGKFYTYAIGVVEYWGESEFIGNYREVNEIPESNIERDLDDIGQYRTILYPELHLYNLQMLWNGLNDKYRHINPRFDCCVDQCDAASLRLIYSLPNNNELSKKDNWLNFRPLNYTQFNQSNGQLTHIHNVDDYNMLLFFEDAVYSTQGQEGLLTTDNNEVYLGTGDSFSRRLKKITTSQSGLGGAVDPLSIINTPYGVFYGDAARKKIFLYNGQLTEITGSTQTWFNEFYRFNKKRDIKNYTDGLISVYDPYSDTVYFTLKGDEEERWTISYKPKMQSFLSWHSFTPDFYIPLNNNFISVKENGLWKHNVKYNYQTYYNQVYPFVIGANINNKFQSLTIQSISVYAEFIKQLGYGSKVIENRFFDKVMVFNDKLSTGYLSTVLKDENNVNHHLIDGKEKGFAEVSLVNDGEYRINNLKNYNIGYPTISYAKNGMVIKPENIQHDITNIKYAGKINGLLTGKNFEVHLINNNYTGKVLTELLLNLNTKNNV